MTAGNYKGEHMEPLIIDDLTDGEKHMIAQYFKRLCFEEVYTQAEGDTKEEMKAYTYRMINALMKIKSALNKQGFNPR